MSEQVHKLFNYKEHIINNELSFEQFKTYLELVNATLRGKKLGDENTGIYQGYMNAFDLITPNNDIQMNILKKYYDALKVIENPKAKAALSYYTLLDLHLFIDGNGRLSRFMYQLFNDKLNLEYVTHDKSDISIKGANFEKDKNYLYIDHLNIFTASILFQELIKSGDIIDDPRLNNINSIRTWGSGMIQDYNDVYIPDDVQEKMSKAEIIELNKNMLNNNSKFTVSGIAMCVTLSKIGTLSKILDLNDIRVNKLCEEYKNNIDTVETISKSLIFRVGNQEIDESKKTMQNWNIDTYRYYNKLSEKIHEQQLETMINIFSKPENYLFDENTTILSEIINEPSINQTIMKQQLKRNSHL